MVTLVKVGPNPTYLGRCSYAGQSPDVSCGNDEAPVRSTNDMLKEAKLIETVNLKMR